VKKAILIIAVLFCMFFLISMNVAAQEFGDITGTVKDVDGGPLPGVTMTLTGSKIVTMTATTSLRGNFRFLNLPVDDNYVLKLELPGFKTHLQENIAVSFGKDVILNVTMEMTRLSEEITVVAENPVIDTKRAQVGVNITEEMIMQLPTARNPCNQPISVTVPKIMITHGVLTERTSLTILLLEQLRLM